MSEQEILSDFPDLTRDAIRACLAFAADRERKLAYVPHVLLGHIRPLVVVTMM